ncbi:serin endopeptidase [Verticillium dahliae VdLs.17]|uniref:Serin endopeptidase n=1 Tax=Verticillium dahliae (strain VdLs.17 / ATCC MYA-4575 / FGSC 10137) TaxID=498257 RepID=G2XJX9_VERDV|nr:serin endopeptidase [Verticillium dahliae VdLs.17]EGY21479.1 serin endopeptidase [Verticillium dahliae VdLs.17]KAH6680121.1 serine endopeptidase [Verticillium dahliae]
MRFDSAFPWLLAASLGLARESQDEDAIAPPMMKGKYAPGAYIAEISDGQCISSLGAQGGVTSVEERIRFDSTVFKGTSFNLGIVQKEDEEEVVRQVGASPEARNIWPVKVISSPQPNLAWTAQGKPLVEVQRRQVGKDGHSPHIMTQVDRFHAEGITEEGFRIGIVDTGFDYTHPAPDASSSSAQMSPVAATMKVSHPTQTETLLKIVTATQRMSLRSSPRCITRLASKAPRLVSKLACSAP